MKKHKSYRMGYDHTLIYDAVSHIGDETDVGAKAKMFQVLRLHVRLSMTDSTVKELKTLIRFLKTDSDVPKLRVTEGVVTELRRNLAQNVSSLIDFSYDLRKARMAMKLKNANLSFEQTFFYTKNLNARKWYRTVDTMNIGNEVEKASIIREYDITPEYWRTKAERFNNPTESHRKGVIAHAVICTEKKRPDGVPFFFPLTLKVCATDEYACGFFADTQGKDIPIPPDWRIFAYKPLDRSDEE